MDLIADILKTAGLKKRLLGQLTLHQAVQVPFPCNKSIGFHVVTHGDAYIFTPKLKQPIHLGRGDIAFMTRGCDHQISTEPRLHKDLPNPLDENFKPLTKGAQAAVPAKKDSPSKSSSAKKETTSKVQTASSAATTKLSLVSGAYQLWNDPIHPFFNELPDWYIIKAEEIASYDKLQTAIQLLSQESAEKNQGSELIVQNLLDIIFTFILRKILEKNSGKEKSFSHALQDREINKAIQLMHADCGKQWSLDHLAKSVGLSRAGFALKFKRTMGETPIQYLTTIRIQTAMQLLSSTEEKIESVAHSVGYQDAFSFSKAFKKLTGTAPRDFRESDRATRELAWRF